jgi:hypothetical protein
MMLESHFLEALIPFDRAIVEEAQRTIGICEDAGFVNRGPDIDDINREFGSPLGSYWCGNLTGRTFKRCGAWIPSVPGDCDAWIREAKRLVDDHGNPLYVPRTAIVLPPVICALIYGTLVPFDAKHIGIGIRNQPLVQTIEGNTTTGGLARNGHTVALKEPDMSQKLATIEQVIGYVRAVEVARVRPA